MKSMNTENYVEKPRQFGGQILPSVFKEAKIFAAKKGISMNTFYEKAILEYIENHSKEATHGTGDAR